MRFMAPVVFDFKIKREIELKNKVIWSTVQKQSTEQI